MTIAKPLTMVGGKLTGRILVRNTSDVTIQGTEVTGNVAPAQQGTIDSDNSSRVRLIDVNIHDAGGSCASFNGGTGNRILDSDLVRCSQQGFHGEGAGTDLEIARNFISGNNGPLAPPCTAGHSECEANGRWDAGWEAGGGKITRSTNIRFIDNVSTNNGGPGLWCDLGCNTTTFSGNRVSGNSIGIFYEVSTGCDVHHNYLWENGWNNPGNAYGGGGDIRISSSRDCIVHDNVMAWSYRGVAIVAQNRSESTTPATFDANRSENNVVISDSAATSMHGWYQADGKRLDVPGNGSSGDRFWNADPEPESARFEWASSPKSTLSSYASTPGGTGATYMTTAQKDAILAANSMPATP